MMPMFELFVARKIYFDKSEGKKISKPAVRIAMWGLAIGLAVMIISVAVVIGFKQEVREKVIGLGAHIQISNFDSNTTYEMQPIAATDSIMEAIRGIDGVKHVQRFTTKPGIIKTGDDFTGIVLKGIGPELCEKYNVRAYPTLLFVDGDGNLVDSWEGYAVTRP